MISIKWPGMAAALLLAAPAVAAALLLAAPAVAAPMVVRAVGPSAALFKPGQKLAETAALTLRAGDRVTILDARGTRSFAGPGSFSLAAASSVVATTPFAELLTQKSERRARIGAVRGPGATFAGTPVPPGVWAVDAGASGTVCALDVGRVSLWRADPLAAGTVTIARAGGGAGVPLAYAAGQAVAAWPAALAISDGDSFKVTGAGAAATIRFRKLAAAPAAVDALGAAFVENGCDGQFQRLAAVTRVGEGAVP
ncbi:hypothetical protein [Sandarakinorhabdus sp. DWP1-3-1]|uniref:hypothetical protein n=1 Tax=Sandarakinorhabdus sp. DWP1-3-1 TaxID=2804627 RepID=UPI003CFB9BE3